MLGSSRMTAGRTLPRLRCPQRLATFDARRPERTDPMLEDVFGIQADDAGESGVHLLHWPPELSQGCVFERGLVLLTVVLDGTQTDRKSTRLNSSHPSLSR